MPYAMTLTSVRASLKTAQTSSGIFTVDINESGSSVLSTKLTIDNTEKHRQTAAAGPVISDYNLADDAEITIDIDQVGDGTAKGLGDVNRNEGLTTFMLNPFFNQQQADPNLTLSFCHFDNC